jgi:hypothetical protein
VATTAAKNEKNEKMSRDKIITCAFLAGVDTKKHGKLKIESNSAACVAGQDHHPKTVESAVTTLSHCVNDKGFQMNEADKGQKIQEKSFMQNCKNVKCCKCGKKGHCGNERPNQDNKDNDESSSASIQSNNSRPSRAGWSGQHGDLKLL